MNTGTANTKYYSEAYQTGDFQAAEESLPESEEIRDLDAPQGDLAAEEAEFVGESMADVFSDGRMGQEQRFSVAGLQTDLQQQEQALAAKLGTEPEHNEARRVHQSIQFFLKRLIPLGEGAAIPQYMMDEYLLLEGELGKVQLQLDTQAQVSGPLSQIEKLMGGIEAALEGVDLKDSEREEMEALLPQLGKARSVLELASDPQSAVQAEASMEELLGRAEELVFGFQEDYEDQRADLHQAMEEFGLSIKYSEARGYYRLKVWKKLAELQLHLEEGTLPLREIALGLMDLEMELQDGVEETEKWKQERAEEEAAQGNSEATPQIKVEGGVDPIGFLVDKWTELNTHEVG